MRNCVPAVIAWESLMGKNMRNNVDMIHYTGDVVHAKNTHYNLLD